ncbi:MAG: HAD-IIIC family phosphatase [Magnetococcus sp. YQC-9]
MKSMDLYRESLAGIKNLIQAGESRSAFDELIRLLDPEVDFAVHHRMAKLFSTLPGNDLDLKPLRVAVVATSTMDHLLPVLRLYLAAAGFDVTLFNAEFNTLHQTVLDPGSELYAFGPEIIWLATHFRDSGLDTLPGATNAAIETAIAESVSRFRDLWQALRTHTSAIILQNNADTPTERIFGNFEGCILWGRANLLRRFNLELAQEARAHHVQLIDLDHLSAQFGRRAWHDAPYWHHSKHAFAPDASGLVARSVAGVIRACKGLSKKCLVLDLDNTLWGGVIGDDGLEGIQLGNGSAAGEAFLAWQHYLKGLNERGIILTVCSKNEEDNAKIPFQEHPEMVLKLTDIAVFVANWHNKADNIRAIAETLELGLDSFVFLDDNPAERELVRRNLPMVTVPELPNDPALYVGTLDLLGCFETTSFSSEDLARGQMYRENAARKLTSQHFTNLEDFLRDLRMVSVYGALNSLTRARASQLILKSNQFHLTTTRYAEKELEAMMNAPGYLCRYYRLEDRFGDNGLISVVILRHDQQTLLVDTWVMSCRVLARGMEEFIRNDMVKQAQVLGCTRLTGWYRPTKKNQLVARLYERLGFECLEECDGATFWQLVVDSTTSPSPVFIEAVEE